MNNASPVLKQGQKHTCKKSSKIQCLRTKRKDTFIDFELFPGATSLINLELHHPRDNKKYRL